MKECPECGHGMQVHRCPCTDALQYVCPECGYSENIEEPAIFYKNDTGEKK